MSSVVLILINIGQLVILTPCLSVCLSISIAQTQFLPIFCSGNHFAEIIQQFP